MGSVRDFVDRLDPELMIQEAMYGFVMSLTFITAAQLGVFHYEDRSTLILAIIGMDFVWGFIDMYIFYRMDIMALHREMILLGRVYVSDDRKSMKDDILNELDYTIFDLVDEETRSKAADLILESDFEGPLEYGKDKRRYLFNAVSAALMTFATAVPAVLCLLFIETDTTAYFWASTISSIALFFIGYRMSPHRRKSLRVMTGLATAAACLILTVFAACLGG